MRANPSNRRAQPSFQLLLPVTPLELLLDGDALPLGTFGLRRRAELPRIPQRPPTTPLATGGQDSDFTHPWQA